MKTRALLALCAASACLCVQAQEMNVIRTDGQVLAYPLADIDSLTFSPLDSLASAWRDGSRNSHDILRVHRQEGLLLIPVADIDSVCFNADEQLSIHRRSAGVSLLELAEIDSLTFASTSENLVLIHYAGASASVVNPLESMGVAVDVAGAHVTVTAAAGLEDIHYVLSGSSPDGMFKAYSDHSFHLRLEGLSLTNLDGPAINIQADEEIMVELATGSGSQLTDGLSYAAAPNGEDQKAAFFSEGQLVFRGDGSLVVVGRGTAAHGLGSDDYILVESGTITVQSAVKDGIHTNEGFLQQGGTVSVTSSSDGVDSGDGPMEIAGGSLTVVLPAADKDALKSADNLEISGGQVSLTVGGNQSKGLSAADILLTGGGVTIHTTGGVVLEAAGSGFDPSYCTAVKADSLVLLDGCQLAITTSGTAGRGLSCEGDIQVLSGGLTVTSSGGGGSYTDADGVLDAYHGPCLNADGDILLAGGTLALTHTGSGGKGVAADGNLRIGTLESSPTLQVSATGTRINIGGGEYAEAKAISVDSLVTIDNGSITLSTVDDAIKSKLRIDVNGGTLNIPSSAEGLEAPNLFINGGTLHLTSSDDGLNATYGNDIEGNDGSNLTISGGYVHLNAATGDGIDSNGNLTISGGTILVHGPGAQPEVGLDVNGTFRVNGSQLIVSQINGNMVETPSGSSTQRCVLARRTQTLSAGTLFHIEDAAGTSLVTFAPSRSYSCILFSSAALSAGTTYRIYTGGSCTGSVQDGLYTGGTYSGGTLRATFTSSSMVQTVNF